MTATGTDIQDMSDPQIVGGQETPKPWPLHERVVKALKGASPFGLLLGWAVISPIVVLAARMAALADGRPEFCGGFDVDCMNPLHATFWIVLFGIVPTLTAFLVLVLLLTVFGVPLRYRLWIAGLGPPLVFLFFAVI